MASDDKKSKRERRELINSLTDWAVGRLVPVTDGRFVYFPYLQFGKGYFVSEKQASHAFYFHKFVGVIGFGSFSLVASLVMFLGIFEEPMKLFYDIIIKINIIVLFDRIIIIDEEVYICLFSILFMVVLHLIGVLVLYYSNWGIVDIVKNSNISRIPYDNDINIWNLYFTYKLIKKREKVFLITCIFVGIIYLCYKISNFYNGGYAHIDLHLFLILFLSVLPLILVCSFVIKFWPLRQLRRTRRIIQTGSEFRLVDPVTGKFSAD